MIGRRNWLFTGKIQAVTFVDEACADSTSENGDDSVPLATCVAVCTTLSRCHACVRVVAYRPQSRKDPEERRVADHRFRHVSTSATIFTAKSGARLETSQGTCYRVQSSPRSHLVWLMARSWMASHDDHVDLRVHVRVNGQCVVELHVNVAVHSIH